MGAKVTNQVNAVIAEASAADSPSWPVLGAFVERIKLLAVRGLMGEDGTGANKKAFVLASIARLFDTLAPSVVLPIWLEPFRWVLMPIAKSWFLLIADGAIEVVYEQLISE